MGRNNLTVIVAALLMTGCGDCLGSTGCGYTSVAVAPQDLTVTGADEMHFADGRGSCLTYNTTEGFNDEVRKFQLFALDLWIPASGPRYKLTLRIKGYRGPGDFSSADSARFGYDPNNGPIISGDGYLVPATEPFSLVPLVAATIAPDELSGSLQLDFSDRQITGSWHCVRARLQNQSVVEPRVPKA